MTVQILTVHISTGNRPTHRLLGDWLKPIITCVTCWLVINPNSHYKLTEFTDASMPHRRRWRSIHSLSRYNTYYHNWLT